MPTVQELKAQAKQCLQLANGTSEYYAKNALEELAQALNRRARQAERRERDRLRWLGDRGIKLGA